MKSYLYGLLAFGVAVAVLGFVGPTLVSARDTMSVIIGFGIVVMLPAFVGWLAFRWSRTREGRRLIKAAKETMDA